MSTEVGNEAGGGFGTHSPELATKLNFGHTR